MEVAVWKLGNDRNAAGDLFLLSNELDPTNRNLQRARIRRLKSASSTRVMADKKRPTVTAAASPSPRGRPHFFPGCSRNRSSSSSPVGAATWRLYSARDAGQLRRSHRRRDQQPAGRPGWKTAAAGSPPSVLGSSASPTVKIRRRPGRDHRPFAPIWSSRRFHAYPRRGFVWRYEGRLLNIHPSLLPALPRTPHPSPGSSKGSASMAARSISDRPSTMDRSSSRPPSRSSTATMRPSLAARVLVQEHRNFRRAGTAGLSKTALSPSPAGRCRLAELVTGGRAPEFCADGHAQRRGGSARPLAIHARQRSFCPRSNCLWRAGSRRR